MKMKKVLLFILLSIGAMSISAQNVLLQNDTIKIVGDSNIYNSSTIVNLDNDGNWANLNGKLVNFDDNLGIVKSMDGDEYDYKINNKFYSINLEARCIQIPIDSNSWMGGNILIDSIYIKVFGNSTITYNLPQLYDYSDTATDLLTHRYIATSKQNFFLATSYKVSDTIKTALCLFDTMGSVIKTKNISSNLYLSSIDHNNKDILINFYQNNKSILYILDADSLNLKDTIEIPVASTCITINDSLIFLTDYSSEFHIFNINTKEYKTGLLRRGNFCLCIPMEYPSEKNKVLSVNNLNDMYIAYNTTDPNAPLWDDAERGIDIINFDVNCNIKNIITYNEYIPDHCKLINGLNATKDSSLILVINSKECNSYRDTTLNYLMKYSYKTGIVGLTDIQKENYSIYPNPVKDKLQITGNYDRIEIYDNIGRNVYNSNKSSDYDLSKLNSGFYLVKIFEENKTYTKKIIKE